MSLAGVYDFFFVADVESKVLIRNDLAPWTLIAAYVVFTKLLGPYWMKNKPPYKLKNTMIIYNFALSAANLYLGIEVTKLIYLTWHDSCRFRHTKSFSKFYVERILCIWHLNLVKYVEMIDTVIFVLRKKFNQITFLHVFHHSCVCLLFWWFFKTKDFGYYLLLILAINSYVHVIMYFYYGLAAIGPEMQRYLWWKRYLTTIQISQFVIVQAWMLHGFVTGCESVDIAGMFLFLSLLTFTVLFCNFYVKTFKRRGKRHSCTK